MDAHTASALPTFAARTPLHIGAVGLVARDLDRLTSFYQELLGLSVIEASDRLVRLGTTGDVTLIEIEEHPDVLPDDEREAGLYHTAFLMPTRSDHARWIRSIAQRRVRLVGASDHGVSEAIYLEDPEGNGIEVYNDRPRERWQYDGDLVVMPTKPLDIETMLRDCGDREPYRTAPAGLRIGHVHLRVGDVEGAERFYRGAVGLALTRRRGGAVFMSSGGYHHHVAANVWHSNGAGMRDPRRAGLAWFSIEAAHDDAYEAVTRRLRESGALVATVAEAVETSDPWGTRIRVVKA